MRTVDNAIKTANGENKTLAVIALDAKMFITTASGRSKPRIY